MRWEYNELKEIMKAKENIYFFLNSEKTCKTPYFHLSKQYIPDFPLVEIEIFIFSSCNL